MKDKWLIGILILFFAVHLSTLAAEHTAQTQHSVSFQSNYFQIKDEFNYGLVVNGMNVGFGYELEKMNQQRLFSYGTELALGLGYGKGFALNGHIKPFDFYYGMKLNEASKVYLGAYSAANYQWQLYPELQSGHMFWFSSLELGPRLHATVQLGNRSINLSASNSLAGLSSRPALSTEQYFYSLKLADFLGNPHSNISFGSFNVMNHTNLKIELPNGKGKRLKLAYEFDYLAHYQATRVDYLTHTLKLSWTLGKLQN